MSLVLRHQPEVIGLTLDAGGWASIEEMVLRATRNGVFLTREVVLNIARDDEKGRYAISEDGLRIKATYGHSLDVDLGLEAEEPPDRLFHGTATGSLNSIKHQGIISKRRRYVHLSADQTTAAKVGSRHGRPVVLTVEAGRMYKAGFRFHHSESGIWLTEKVPVDYIDFASLVFPDS